MSKKNMPEQTAEKTSPEKNAPLKDNQSKKEQAKIRRENEKPQAEKSKKSPATALALLAILLTLGISGAGMYFGKMHGEQYRQKMSQLEKQVTQLASEDHSSAWQKTQQELQALQTNANQLSEKVALLNGEINIKDQAINALQTQINRINAGVANTQPKEWKVAEADYLLNNAYRKLLIDKDVPTAIALLQLTEKTLSKVDDPSILTVRTAISRDLEKLMTLHIVDDEKIMHELSTLTNEIEGLMLLSLRQKAENAELTDSVADWKANLEKTATSFLNNFIRATPKNATTQELLTPQQEIYLRENIRLRLQVALMAVPRGEEALYQQSLAMVKGWIERYFDVENAQVKEFLQQLTALQKENVEMALPSELESLNLMQKLLDSQSLSVVKD